MTRRPFGVLGPPPACEFAARTVRCHFHVIPPSRILVPLGTLC
ncbi:hypothetical protein GZL_02686 [Streptomyces sp. 769]|nr:hypothetical protein GZL_02686 [Streptomyces sp. 769]